MQAQVLMSTISKVEAELERIAEYAVGTATSSNTLTMTEIKAQVLGSYALYMAQRATITEFNKLASLQAENLGMQAQVIKEMKEQTKATKRVALATFVLAIGTVSLAIITFVFHGH